MNLADSSVLITGGGSGFGKFLAMGLAGVCAKVIVIDKNQEALDAMDDSQGIQRYQCDLTKPSEVAICIERIYNECSAVNVLVNNAGFIHSEPLFNMLRRDEPKHSIENWQKTIDANLNSVFYTTVNVVEKMRSGRVKEGVIINISSIAAFGNLGQSAYSAAKAGVEALTATWSKELGMFKIRCAAIAPGFFDTESTQKALSESVLDKWKQSVPLRRLGQPAEILSAVKFIIENDYFNGRILNIDGGLTI